MRKFVGLIIGTLMSALPLLAFTATPAAAFGLRGGTSASGTSTVYAPGSVGYNGYNNYVGTSNGPYAGWNPGPTGAPLASVAAGQQATWVADTYYGNANGFSTGQPAIPPSPYGGYDYLVIHVEVVAPGGNVLDLWRYQCAPGYAQCALYFTVPSNVPPGSYLEETGWIYNAPNSGVFCTNPGGADISTIGISSPPSATIQASPTQLSVGSTTTLDATAQNVSPGDYIRIWQVLGNGTNKLIWTCPVNTTGRSTCITTQKHVHVQTDVYKAVVANPNANPTTLAVSKKWAYVTWHAISLTIANKPVYLDTGQATTATATASNVPHGYWVHIWRYPIQNNTINGTLISVLKGTGTGQQIAKGYDTSSVPTTYHYQANISNGSQILAQSSWSAAQWVNNTITLSANPTQTAPGTNAKVTAKANAVPPWATLNIWEYSTQTAANAASGANYPVASCKAPASGGVMTCTGHDTSSIAAYHWYRAFLADTYLPPSNVASVKFADPQSLPYGSLGLSPPSQSLTFGQQAAFTITATFGPPEL